MCMLEFALFILHQTETLPYALPIDSRLALRCRSVRNLNVPGVQVLFIRRPSLCGKLAMYEACHALTNHVQVVLKVLRDFRREGDKAQLLNHQGGWSKLFPRIIAGAMPKR
eukprot:12368901-Alexandrium_andersonii.AAC.1